MSGMLKVVASVSTYSTYRKLYLCGPSSGHKTQTPKGGFPASGGNCLFLLGGPAGPFKGSRATAQPRRPRRRGPHGRRGRAGPTPAPSQGGQKKGAAGRTRPARVGPHNGGTVDVPSLFGTVSGYPPPRHSVPRAGQTHSRRGFGPKGAQPPLFHVRLRRTWNSGGL